MDHLRLNHATPRLESRKNLSYLDAMKQETVVHYEAHSRRSAAIVLRVGRLYSPGFSLMPDGSKKLEAKAGARSSKFQGDASPESESRPADAILSPLV